VFASQLNHVSAVSRYLKVPLSRTDGKRMVNDDAKKLSQLNHLKDGRSK
jgi:hypothetical protein